MTKLSKEGLLRWLKDLKEDLKTAGWDDEVDEEAYQQIRELIQEEISSQQLSKSDNKIT